ncbi:condensation domain-containing protein [Streptomyces sp. NPDC059690]|uniref:condensation domain-containing protein n=1 Tax=Streptomyces sp. NPDC059690 TaxID=3346907 RepID=UPI003693E945
MSDRAELGEVRAALVSLPGVRDAAVHAARHAVGGLRIIAHVVTRTPPAELRAALRSRLPSHLLPARLHRVPHIPLLPDGNTDHRALAALTTAGSNTAPAPAEEPRWAAASVPVTPQQRALLPHALAHRATGRWVQQLHWRWHGPLDTGRFTAAWQSVFAHESVLRAAFDTGSGPRLVLHEHVRAEVVRHPAGSVDFDRLRDRDRLRGFDLRSPGLLRLHLVDEEAPHGGSPPPVRILLTFHTLALDDFSVSVLLEEFYRAYLAAGRLPGGERRPDHRDYARWLAGQDTTPARDFWSSAAPDTAALIRPGIPGPATGLTGYGRAETRLGAGPAGRLRTWAASHAATEAGALQAVWALLLYRAGATAGPALVGFGVSVLGRGIALDFVQRLPGLLANTLPMTVRVDPDAPVARLLADLRELALEMAAYEWVSLEQIRAWSGRRTGDELIDSLVVFEHRRRGPGSLRSALAAQGISVEEPRPAGTPTVFPVTLQARRDADDGLHLSAVHDRARLTDADAARLLGQCARLLRELPHLADGAATVSDALAALADEPPAAMACAPAATATGAPT